MKFISPENIAILKTRLIALCWHAGTMLAAIAIDFITVNISLFNIPDFIVVIIGLVLAQITKYLNTPKV
jgi:hypothetical protein